MLKKGDQALAAARNALRKDGMAVPDAFLEKVAGDCANDEQKAEAERLGLIVKFAREYHQFILQGSQKWKASEAIEIAEGAPIVKVESDARNLTIRASGKNRTFALNAVPIVIADAIVAWSPIQRIHRPKRIGPLIWFWRRALRPMNGWIKSKSSNAWPAIQPHPKKSMSAVSQKLAAPAETVVLASFNADLHG